MPVVLATADGKERSGYVYDDRTGISYEYPRGRYENWIATGDRFVYHKPHVGYVGTGIIGGIRPSTAAGRLVCDILDYTAFGESVPLKRSNGEYFEADLSVWKTGRVYWAQGVRQMREARFEELLSVASAGTDALPRAGQRNHGGAGGYARPEVGAAVDSYAMDAAAREIAARWPGALVERMPHNNPGFDIRVGPPSSELWFYEVKGTQASEPVFFLSEGERRFSIRESARYSLLVVVGISLRSETHTGLAERAGAVTGTGVALEPTQWRGRLTE